MTARPTAQERADAIKARRRVEDYPTTPAAAEDREQLAALYAAAEAGNPVAVALVGVTP